MSHNISSPKRDWTTNRNCSLRYIISLVFLSDTKLMQHENWLEASLPLYPHHLLLWFHLYAYNLPNVPCCFNYACSHNFAQSTCFSLFPEYCNPPIQSVPTTISLPQELNVSTVYSKTTFLTQSKSLVKYSEIYSFLYLLKLYHGHTSGVTLNHTLNCNYQFIHIPLQAYAIP